MILRRLSKHVQEQNWFAFGLDVLIVVVGVFLGIQVSNWNSARIERNQERDYPIRLHEDVLESAKGQSRDIAFLDQQLSDQAVILSLLTACAVDADDLLPFQRGINSLGFINPPRIFRRTVDEMTAAGKLDILRNGSIKKELGAIVSLVEWRGAGYASVARTVEHYRYIVEARLRHDFARAYPDPFLEQFAGVSFDIEALCAEPIIASAVSAIRNTTQERRRAYQPILDRYRLILPSLSNELDARWNLHLNKTPESH